MSNTFKRTPPPTDGAKSTAAYARFIPREELGEFAAWRPGSIGGDTVDDPVDPEPKPPSDADVQALVAAARQNGYQDGYRDGLVALDGFKQSFAAQSTQQIGALLHALDSQFAALEAQMAQAVATSAVQLARQVVRDEVHTHPELVVRIAAEAVQSVLLSARHITLQVHPLDLPLVEAGAAEAIESRGAHLVGSDAIERGGCRIESDIGAIDARIATRWAQAAQSLGADVAWRDE